MSYFGHDGLLFVLVDGDGCAMHPRVGAEVTQTHERRLRYQRIGSGQRRRIHLENGSDFVRVRYWN